MLVGRTWSWVKSAAKDGASDSRRWSCSGVTVPTSVSSPRASGPWKKSARLASLSRERPMRPKACRSSTKRMRRPPLRVLEQLEAALLPVADVAHAGDDPLAGDGPDLGHLVQVAVGLEAIGLELIGHEALEQGPLAAAGGPDEQHGRAPLAAEQELELLAVGVARHAGVERALGGLEGEVRPELVQHPGAPARLLLLLLAVPVLPILDVQIVPGPLLLAELVEQRLRPGHERERLEAVLAVGAQLLVLVRLQGGPGAGEEDLRLILQTGAGVDRGTTRPGARGGRRWSSARHAYASAARG